MRWATRSDRGGPALEYAGLIGIAALIIAVIALNLPAVSGRVSDAICKILSIAPGCGDSSDDNSADEDQDRNNNGIPDKYEPEYCIRQSDSKHQGFTVSLGPLTMGKDHKYLKETLSDDRVVVTFVPETSGKLSAGIGPNLGSKSKQQKAKALSLKASGEAGIAAKTSPGMTYFFKDEKEYQRFKDQVDTAISQEIARDNSQYDGVPGSTAMADWYNERNPAIKRDPTVKSATVGVEGSLEGGLGVWGKNMKEGHRNEGKQFNVNTGVDGSTSVSDSVDTSKWYDEKDNVKTTNTYEYSTTDTFGANWLNARYQHDATRTGATRIMRNQDGSLKNIRYTTKIQSTNGRGGKGEAGKGRDKSGNGKHNDGKGEAVTQMIQLDFDTPEEQKQGEKLLEKRGVEPPKSAVQAMTNPYLEHQGIEPPDKLKKSLEDWSLDPKEGGDINAKPGEGAPEWEKLFYDKGRVWQFKQDVDTEETEIDATLKYGMNFGASFGWGSEKADTRTAQILGAPGKDGQRRFVDYPDCVSKRGN